MSTFLPVLNEVEKASIGERQPLPAGAQRVRHADAVERLGAEQGERRALPAGVGSSGGLGGGRVG